MEENTGAKLGREKMMVIFPIIGGVAIGGFGVVRFVNDQMLLAAFDAVIAVCFFSLSFYTYMTGKDRLSRYVSALLSIVGPLVLLKNFDGIGHYWVYSSAIVLFYLLPYPQAIIGNGIMLAGAGLIYAQGSQSQLEFYSFLVTIALINLFSLLFALNEERQKGRLKEMSMLDELTGIGNRRAYVEKINETLNLYKRHHRSACLVYVDIDRFKTVNDSFGHAVGDLTIKRLAKFIVASVRETDSVFRLGGDEFVIIAEVIDESTATQLSEKVRQAVETEGILPEHVVTISMGVTMLLEDDTADSWIVRADRALYRAKQSGRNNVTTEREACSLS